MKEEMLRILLRGRSKTLGEACRAVGITPTTFYYRLKKATFGTERRGRHRRVALSSLETSRLSALIRRQERLQNAFQAFTRTVLGH